MTTFDTTRWYQHSNWQHGDHCRPVVPEADSSTFIPVVTRCGYYELVDADLLTFIPERHTVERRPPKAGERRIDYNGDIITTGLDAIDDEWVIVEVPT